jgi:hypothetical protein
MADLFFVNTNLKSALPPFQYVVEQITDPDFDQEGGMEQAEQNLTADLPDGFLCAAQCVRSWLAAAEPGRRCARPQPSSVDTEFCNPAPMGESGQLRRDGECTAAPTVVIKKQ